MSRLLIVVMLIAVGWLTSLAAQALPLLRVLAPLDGYVVEDDEVDVWGAISSSAGGTISVTVNGVAAHVLGGRFLLPGVRLAEGSNVLEINAADQDGSSVRVVRVWSTGPAQIKLVLRPAQGFAPLDVQLDVADRLARPVTRMEVDFIGSGPAQEMVAPVLPLSHTYYLPGIYAVRATVTFSDGTLRGFRRWVVVTDHPLLDAVLKSIWYDFRDALTERDGPRALRLLTETAKIKYEPVFDALQTDLAALASSFMPIETVALHEGFAEYLVARNVDGQARWFFVHFLQGDDGQWRLEQM